MDYDYPIQPVPFTQVSIEDSFWSPRIETNRSETIQHGLKMCEETGRIENFLRAAGKAEGAYEGRVFNDSDIYKILEGIAYTLQTRPDPELEAYMERLIAIVGDAQEDDGYLYTPRTIDPEHPPDRTGDRRWDYLYFSHELYNAGHLYEAAVAHYQLTGRRNLLDIAIKNADLLVSVFGPDRRRDVPGHQEVELGLVKLYRVTGDERYLQLADFFLQERGHANGRELYADRFQDHAPIVEQNEAVGHAVRAGYMYSAIADIAAITGNADFVNSGYRLWNNVVGKKLSLTGGVGARHTHERFGDAYELPNLTVYNETCAAIANIYWNHRLFLLTGESRYIDILERTLYNGFLAGVSLSGKEFFYVNPLEADGEYTFNRGFATRQPWFQTSCCPTNVVRFLPSLPGYMYAVRDHNLYVNLYAAGSAQLAVGGTEVRLVQETDYPWQGQVTIHLELQETARFTLCLRKPGWARNQPVPSDLYRYVDHPTEDARLSVNSDVYDGELVDGYWQIERQWQAGDIVSINLPMPVRRVLAHPEIVDDRGKVAIERGPLLYVAEGVDHDGHVLDLVLPDRAELSPRWEPDLLHGLIILEGQIFDTRGTERKLKAIPYYAWSNRGVNEMIVWFRQRH